MITLPAEIKMAWSAFAKSKVCHRKDKGMIDYSYSLLTTESPIIYIYVHMKKNL